MDWRILVFYPEPEATLFELQFMLPMEKSVTFTGACANEIMPNA
jgi:hypothetical protein